MSQNRPFKTCTMCGKQWMTPEDFILDPELDVLGYQATLGHPDEGVIVLMHRTERCGTSVGLAAWVLRPLYRGPEYADMLYGTEHCGLLCVEEERLEECEAPCGMAWVRRVIQYLRNHELPEATVAQEA